MQILTQDLRYAARVLARNPGFTVAVTLAMAFGIGANVAVFSVVNAVLLRPLPFASPERLVTLWTTDQARSGVRAPVSYPDFRDWREGNHVFEQMAVYRTIGFILTGVDRPALVEGAVVSADLFSILGVSPSLGRVFLPGEDQPSGDGRVAAILADSLWRRSFHSDPQVLGRSIVLDGKVFTVVGVMPAGFRYPLQGSPVELWVSLALDAQAVDGGPPMVSRRGSQYLKAIGLLKPHVTLQQARADMDSIARSVDEQYSAGDAHKGVELVPQLDLLVSDFRQALWLLLGAAGCLLLITCGSIANLWLARSTARHHEISIRQALGASRPRLLRQLLTESLLLATGAGLISLLLARWGTHALVSLSPWEIPRLAETRMDLRVLSFAVALSVVAGVLFGLLPALQKSSLQGSINDRTRGSTDGVKRSRLRRALVVTQISLALTLSVGAALLIQSLLRLVRISPGFDPHRVLSFRLVLPNAKYSYSQQVDLYQQVLSRLRDLPGVHSAGAVFPLPLSGKNFAVGFDIEGRTSPRGRRSWTEFRAASSDYFRTMGIATIKGRDFTPRDDLNAEPVAIINETFARRHFAGEDPIGKRVITRLGRLAWARQIIGVVGDVRHEGLVIAPKEETYVPLTQMPFNFMTIVVRTERPPETLVAAVRNDLKTMDSDLPVPNVIPLRQFLADSIARPRFQTLLLGIFAVTAILLSCISLYGVISYSVTQRTQEIGIRLALGARPGQVVGLFFKQGLRSVLTGVAIGLAGALLLTRLMSGLLYGVRPTDGMTFVAVPLIFASVSLLASYIPARRAAAVDPVVALRYD